MATSSPAFEAWKSRALEADILKEAVARGAKLKRAGREWVGACVACGGKDRFSINISKRVFNCRGSEGGDVAKMVMHLDGVSFTQAIEALTGEPPPNGQSKPLSDAEKAARDKQRAQAQATQRAREAQERAYQEDTREAAQAIWEASKSIAATVADSYLLQRGFVGVADPVLRFHPALPYPGKTRTFPALICRVDDVAGDLTAVWRIFLRNDGRKADVDNAKLGLGPAGGGAVRIGGIGKKIGIAEGVESALGAWNLIGRRYPVWAALSTSGMIGIEIPLGVEQVVIFADGDAPMKKQGDEYVAAIPAGRKAALTAKANIEAAGVKCMIAAEPPPGRDFNDLWLDMQREFS